MRVARSRSPKIISSELGREYCEELLNWRIWWKTFLNGWSVGDWNGIRMAMENLEFILLALSLFDCLKLHI